MDQPRRSDADKNYVLGFVPLQGCWLHGRHLFSCCFDDKAKPLREWRCVSSA